MYGLSVDFIIGSRSKEARKIANNNNTDGKNYDEMVAKSVKKEGYRTSLDMT
jgi:hypothetical protein